MRKNDIESLNTNRYDVDLMKTQLLTDFFRELTLHKWGPSKTVKTFGYSLIAGTITFIIASLTIKNDPVNQPDQVMEENNNNEKESN